MGIFAVAQRLGKREVDADSSRQAERLSDLAGNAADAAGSSRILIQCVCNGGIISGGQRRACFANRQRVARLRAPLLAFQFFDEGGIVGDAGDDGDVFKVFGGGADHGGAADVDVLDEMAEGDAGLGGGFLKGIEIDDDHVDGLDAVRGDGGLVLLIAANVEQAAVDLGMEGLDAAVEHLGKAGELADVLDGEAGFAEGARRCRRWR